MSEIKWQEPPQASPGGPRTSKWKPIFAALRERPGEWALVDTSRTRDTAMNIKRGRLADCEPGEFEATSVGRKDGQVDIYARYVGEVSA